MAKKTETMILCLNPLAVIWEQKEGWISKSYEIKRAQDIMGTIELFLAMLIQKQTKLMSRLEKIDDKQFTESSHRSRRYLARDKDILYINKDKKFTNKYSVELFGYWFATNIGKKELRVLFSNACEAANVPHEVVLKGLDIVKR